MIAQIPHRMVIRSSRKGARICEKMQVSGGAAMSGWLSRISRKSVVPERGVRR
jgi:hypothetical protein